MRDRSACQGIHQEPKRASPQWWAPLVILNYGIKELQGPILSYVSNRAESVLGTVYPWSPWVEVAAHYFRDTEFASNLCSWCPRQHYSPLPGMRRSMSSFLGNVSMKHRQGPLGLICEGHCRALFLRELEKTLLRTGKNSLWAFKSKIKKKGKMRLFPGKLDLNILSVGGEADTGTDLAGRLGIQSGNKQSSSSECLLSSWSVLSAFPVIHSRLALLWGSTPWKLTSWFSDCSVTTCAVYGVREV